MALDVIFLVDGSRRSLKNYYWHKGRFPHIKKLETLSNDLEVYKEAAQLAKTKLFYVVDHYRVIQDFEFDYIPPEYDYEYVHAWNNYNEHIRDGVYLFHKDHLAKKQGIEIMMNIKWMPVISKPLPLDVIFIAYDEPNANTMWQKLLNKAPHAERIDGVHGIFNAHKAAADLSDTSSFFVVDGDSEIVDGFDFNVQFYKEELESYVHLWKAKNPVTNQAYGYGGLKLFHKKMFDIPTTDYIDMTTVLGNGLKVIDEVASITHFNSDALRSFRAAFRETSKLAAQISKDPSDKESWDRLEAWHMPDESANHYEYVKIGAEVGSKYGTDHYLDKEALSKINEFSWLTQQFIHHCDHLIKHCP